MTRVDLDRRLLERSDETLASDVALIASEFLAGFQAVQQIDRPAVSIFGSARVGEELAVYTAARATGRLFAEDGFAVVTGGGPGVMEAANRGARRRVGCPSVSTSAPARAGRQPVLRHRPHLPPLLRAQDDVREGRRGLRDLRGRLRDAGRAVRGADADPDRQDRQLPDRPDRDGLLAGAARLGARRAPRRRSRSRRHGRRAPDADRRPAGGRADWWSTRTSDARPV